MKIINYRLLNSTLTLELDAEMQDGKIYLDTCDNYNNVWSDKDEDHTIVLNEKTGSILTVTELDHTAYIVTIISETDKLHVMVYDEENLYNHMVNTLIQHCDNCLDKQQKEKMMLCDLQYNLLRFATENDLFEDIIVHYNSLCRTLNMSNKYNHFEKNVCENNKCKMCLNGCCSLC